MIEFILNIFKKKEVTKEEQRNKLTKTAYRRKNRSHKFSKNAITLFIIMNVLFFLSPMYLPKVIKGSPFSSGTLYNLGNGKEVNAMRYDYSEAEEKAELEIDIKDKDFAPGDYQVGAVQNGKRKQVEIVIDDPLNKIFQIHNITPDDRLTFTIQFNGNDTEASGSADIKFVPKYLTKVSSLPIKTPTEYKIQRLNLEINNIKQEIKEIENKIELLNETNKNIDTTISSLEAEKSAKTENEKMEINTSITENLATKKENEATINDYLAQIQVLKDSSIEKETIIGELKRGE